MERIAGAKDAEGSHLIGQFGVGFYSVFMVADRVEVVSRRAGTDTAASWSSDGLGTYTIQPVDIAEAPARGTRVLLHLKEDAASYTESSAVERTLKTQSGHVPVPIFLKDKPDAEPQPTRRWRGAVDPTQGRDHAGGISRISTAAPPASSTSRR